MRFSTGLSNPTVMNNGFCLIGGGALLAMAPMTARGEAGTRPDSIRPAMRPNVVVILADDVAWGDIGANGAVKTHTPHIDALAAEGVNFVNGYAAASTSTPTRYAMLTGRYAFRDGYQILPGDAPLIVPEENLASRLKADGYATGVIGKWHLGLGDGKPDWNGHMAPSPNDIGFDYSFIIPGTVDRVPCVYVENGRVYNHDVSAGDAPIEVDYDRKVGSDPTGLEHPEMRKLPWLAKNHSMTIVNGIARMGWMTGGYRARWVDETIVDVMTERAVKYIEEHAAGPFFLYFATHDAHEPRVVNPRFEGISECGVYGDVVAQFDYAVGRVVEALKRAGVFDHTILIVSSDNGPQIREGYRDGALEGLNGHDPFGGLRGHKYGIYDGGLKVPFVVSWPDGMAGRRVEPTPVSLANLYPTIAELVGNGFESGKVHDARSDAAVYLDDGAAGNVIYMQNAGGQVLALRSGRWKYIEYSDGRGELYDLETDPGERNNLLAAYPDVCRRLASLMAAFKRGD